jgi:hypothetical protein
VALGLAVLTLAAVVFYGISHSWIAARAADLLVRHQAVRIVTVPSAAATALDDPTPAH